MAPVIARSGRSVKLTCRVHGPGRSVRSDPDQSWVLDHTSHHSFRTNLHAHVKKERICVEALFEYRLDIESTRTVFTGTWLT